MEKDSNLRDDLAVQRNKLANERTILAYVRTALSFIGFGVLILKLFPERNYYIIAMVSILLGLLFLIIGFVSYRKHKKIIQQKR